jgi:hypothetical protein
MLRHPIQMWAHRASKTGCGFGSSAVAGAGPLTYATACRTWTSPARSPGAPPGGCRYWRSCRQGKRLMMVVVVAQWRGRCTTHGGRLESPPTRDDICQPDSTSGCSSPPSAAALTMQRWPRCLPLPPPGPSCPRPPVRPSARPPVRPSAGQPASPARHCSVRHTHLMYIWVKDCTKTAEEG